MSFFFLCERLATSNDMKMGRGEAVTQRTLDPLFGGSNPPAPAKNPYIVLSISLKTKARMKISQIGEFGLIQRIRSSLRAFQQGAVVGIGDDTAVVEVSSVDLILFTSDTLVEDIHFKWDYTSLRELGWKALAVNISDIAAIGGSPTYCLVSLGLSKDKETSLVDELYEGLKEVASLSKVGIIGGDLVYSSVFFITISLLGQAKREEIILRSGAQKGDLIYVTGELGTAAAGLACLEKSSLPIGQSVRESLIERHLKPFPRFREGQEIGRRRVASAMIDISDGLASDLTRLGKESDKGAVLWEEELPVAPSSKTLAKILKQSFLKWALYGGEDYELLFTVPPGKKKLVEEELDFSCSLIGEVVDKREGISIINKRGTRTRIEGGGYDHFLKKEEV